MVGGINRKKKQCNTCGDVTYLFSKGRCKPCSMQSYKPIKKSNKNSNENQQYYKLAWDSHRVKQCEECDKALHEFNPCHISHIISKGSNPAVRSDLRNHPLLCMDCHQTYEFGNRKAMRTYHKAQAIRLELMQEYYNVSKASDIPPQSPPHTKP